MKYQRVLLSLIIAFLAIAFRPLQGKPSSIRDIIVNAASTASSALSRLGLQAAPRSDWPVATARDGYGGGGYGGMSYYSNYDTALTALAFLSFGVFLLNLLLMALNRTSDGRRRRSSDPGDVNTFSDLMYLIQDALSESLFDSKLPDCAVSSFCAAKEKVRRHRSVDQLLTPLNSMNILSHLTDLYPSPSWRSIVEFFRDDCAVYEARCPTNTTSLPDIQPKPFYTPPRNSTSKPTVKFLRYDLDKNKVRKKRNTLFDFIDPDRLQHMIPTVLDYVMQQIT